MSARTLAEKILSKHAGCDARVGELRVCTPDLVLGTDGSTPMALDYFDAMGGTTVAHPERVLLARDHYAPPTSDATRGFHARMADFAATHGVSLLPVGGGISFQVALETGRVGAGDLVVGADSHTVMCGAVGAFATGIGSADLAGALCTGRVWLKVPETWRVVLSAPTPTGVGAKDVALALISQVGSDGATYIVLEFGGPGASALPVEERMVLSNMSVEMGAKAGVFPADPVALEWTVARGGRLQEAVVSDIGATVGREIVLETDALEPRVALPHDQANGVPVSEAAGAAIDFVFLGTCTGGRVHDFHEALRVLELGGGIAPGVTVVVTPPTPHVRGVLTDDGTLARLEALGAVVTETGCGPCCGTSPPIPPENARVLSTANRNFQARMGRASASVYLASPGTCAAGATAGRIVDPREVA